MNHIEQTQVDSENLSDFSRVMKGCTDQCTSPKRGRRINLEQNDVKNGLGQLVLTLIKLLHELIERQAIRRIDAGSLNDDEIERLGITLMRQAQEIERLRKEFGLEEDDLNIDLGPIGRLF